MKMKEKDGFWYSLEPFSTYTNRAKLVIIDNDWNDLINTYIYTNNPNREEVANIFMESAGKKFTEGFNELRSGIIYWTTKEQDEWESELLDEILNF